MLQSIRDKALPTVGKGLAVLMVAGFFKVQEMEQDAGQAAMAAANAAYAAAHSAPMEAGATNTWQSENPEIAPQDENFPYALARGKNPDAQKIATAYLDAQEAPRWFSYGVQVAEADVGDFGR